MRQRLGRNLLISLAFSSVSLLGCGAEEDGSKNEAAELAAKAGKCDGGQTDGPCTYFDKQGRRSLDVTYVSGQLNGTWTAYYENGQIASQGGWVDGKQAGEWKHWHYNGQQRLVGNYTAGKKDGSWTFSDLDAKPVGSNAMTAGSGSWTEFDSMGNKLYTATMADGEPNGQRIWYGANGTKSHADSYLNGIRSGAFIAWHDGGTQKLSEHTYRDGKKHGTWTEWFANSQKSSERTFAGGKKNGTWGTWYINGQEASRRGYAMGKREGAWAEFFADGTRKSEASYKTSTRDGAFRIWFANGNPKSEEHYAMGRKIGAWKTWYEDGKEKSSETYANGRREGSVVGFYADGTQKSDQAFADGMPNGAHTTWYENGQIKTVIVYAAGVKHGATQAYFDDGKLKEEGALAQGKKAGTWKAWYKTGQQKSEANFADGLRKGAYTEWHPNGAEWTTGQFDVEEVDDAAAEAAVGAWNSGYPNGKIGAKVDFTKGTLQIADEAGNNIANATRADAKSEWLDARQSMSVTGKFRDGKLDGNWTLARPGGGKVMQYAFKNGRLATFKKWHSTGSLLTEGAYKDGKANGKWSEWDRYGNLLNVTCLSAGERVWMSFETPNPKASCP